jgi:hypothetical protein
MWSQLKRCLRLISAAMDVTMFIKFFSEDFVCCCTDEFTLSIDSLYFPYLDPRIFGGA